MPSTVNVPLLGKQNKGTVVGVTIGGVVVAGYMIYRRQKKANQQAVAAQTAASAGYGYGTSQTTLDNANGYYGYGASGGFPAGYFGYGVPQPPVTTLPVANTTNAQWAQAAITQLEQDGYDPQTVAGALGAYELGQPVNANQQGIIQAAIAIEGYPPVSGANGFPPGINVQGTTGGGTGGGQGGGTGGGTPKPPSPETETVPHVAGERAREGLADLRAAGFKARTSPFRTPGREYVITGTRPAAGTRARKGSLVTAEVRVNR